MDEEAAYVHRLILITVYGEWMEMTGELVLDEQGRVQVPLFYSYRVGSKLKRLYQKEFVTLRTRELEADEVSPVLEEFRLAVKEGRLC